ncbi:MAG TPA: hypothetical protein VLX92_32120 [Kofleriaceae bacterium]|nr:hypothetical protein [Kofleriaceae bacterium]
MNRIALVLLAGCTAGFSLSHGLSSSSSASASPSSGGGANAPVLASSGGSHFDVNRDCYGEHGRVDWHRDPILFWPCFEYDELKNTAEYSDNAKNCDEVNDLLKSKIACRIDHKGFDAHFAEQAKIMPASQRDSSDPGSYCSMVYTEFAGREALVTGTLHMFNKTPAARKEFLAKVNQITCAYDDKRAHTVELQGKNLVFFVGQKADSTGWQFPEFRRLKQFPELEKVYAEYGECQGGFSC